MSKKPFEPTEHPFRRHKGLVILVASLGMLIILGFVGLVYGIAQKASKSNAPETETMPSAAVPPTIPMVPGGITVLGMTAADGSVYLTLRLVDGSTVLRGYDETGQQLFETPLTSP